MAGLPCKRPGAARNLSSRRRMRTPGARQSRAGCKSMRRARCSKPAGIDFAGQHAAAAHQGFRAVPLKASADATLHNSIRAFNSQNVLALWPGHRGMSTCCTARIGTRWESMRRGPATIFQWSGRGRDRRCGSSGAGAVLQAHRPKARSFHRVSGHDGGGAGPFGLAVLRAESDSAVARNRCRAQCGHVVQRRPNARHQHPRVRQLRFGRLSARGSAAAGPGGASRTRILEFGWYFLSDSYSFANRGIPVLYTQAGIDSSARGPAWGKAHIEDYFEHRFRQPGDQYSPDWELSGAVNDLTLYYQVGMRLAGSKRFPRWYPNSEFRTAHHRANPVQND